MMTAECTIAQSGQYSWGVSVPAKVSRYFEAGQQWTVAYGLSETQWVVPPSFTKRCPHIIKSIIRDWLEENAKRPGDHIFLRVVALKHRHLRLALDLTEIRAFKQEDDERFFLSPFLSLVRLKPSKIIPGGNQPPDFIVVQRGQRIAIELTEFYSTSSDTPSPGWEKAWTATRSAMAAERDRYSELHDICMGVTFNKRPLPRRNDQAPFAAELAALALRHLDEAEGEAIILGPNDFQGFALLKRHLAGVEVRRSDYYETWDLADRSFSCGLQENELLAVLERKQYSAKEGADELWLVVVSGSLPCQSMGLPIAEELNRFSAAKMALANGPYDRVYLYDYMWDRVLCWHASTGWRLVSGDV